MTYYQFPNPVIFAVSGRDSERYLNARLTNNIKTLEINQSCLAAQLSPQGKTEGLFRVYREKSDHFLLYADGGDSSQILSAFKRYIVADRVEVEDLSASFILVHSLENLTNFSLSFSCQRTAIPGFDLLIKNEDAKILAEHTALSVQEYNLMRAEYGFPAYPEELSEDLLFPESGLRSAVSYNKGCYCGQEVVERVDAIGKLPARLALLHCIGEYNFAGESIKNQDKKTVGEVLSSYSSQKNTYSFVRIKNLVFSELQIETIQQDFVKFIEV